jgi:hypothetical protein
MDYDLSAMLSLWHILFLLLLVLMAAAIAAIIIRARQYGRPQAAPEPSTTTPPPSSGRIRVEIIEANMKHHFRPTHFAPEQLPESFEAATTMHLDQGDFEVVEATPMTAAEFRRTGNLRLVVRERKIVKLDASEMLYSLATISNELPPIEPGTSKLEKQVIELHEDDWRQVEFVAMAQQEQIDAELAAIGRIYGEQRTEEGFFRAIHVRAGLTEPLAGTAITLAELIAAFDPPPPMQLDGIAYRDVAGLVANGFALRLLSGIELLGVVDEAGHIAVLCLSHARPNIALERDLPALSRFAQAHRFCLINWYRAEQFPAEESALRALFQIT